MEFIGVFYCWFKVVFFLGWGGGWGGGTDGTDVSYRGDTPFPHVSIPCSLFMQVKLSEYELEDVLRGCIDKSKLHMLLSLLRTSLQLSKQGKPHPIIRCNALCGVLMQSRINRWNTCGCWH